MTPVLKFMRLAHGEGLPMPTYATPGAAGVDLMCALDETQSRELCGGQGIAIPTGFAVCIPDGFEGQVRGRSGLAYRNGVGVVQGVGTIDSDYRGEIIVLLVNHCGGPFTISRGMRIAQLVISPVARALILETESLDGTRRGAGGFGSTGV